MERIHQVEDDREGLLLDLDEIARRGARRMLAEALEAEVHEYLEATRGERDEHGRALVVRNGHARERQVLLGVGAVEVKAPRVNDRRVDENGIWSSMRQKRATMKVLRSTGRDLLRFGWFGHHRA